jgi:hypothetical protein
VKLRPSSGSGGDEGVGGIQGAGQSEGRAKCYFEHFSDLTDADDFEAVGPAGIVMFQDLMPWLELADFHYFPSYWYYTKRALFVISFT